MTALTLRALNRTTLHRQFLLERSAGSAAEVIGHLAGLQAQHATWPYVALWARRHTTNRQDLEDALTDRSAVKATLMRTTLHIVAAGHLRALDVMSALPRLATWQASAKRAGVDLRALNAEARAFCREPHTVAEIEAHIRDEHPAIDLDRHIPSGVRNPWFRLAAAGGGLVHTPPSGFFGEHGKPRYADIDTWLTDAPTSQAADVDPADVLQTGIQQFLTAYGPATITDLMQWSGQRRIGLMRAAVKALGDRLTELDGPDGMTYLDLADLELTPADTPAPPRFLARWDSMLIAYAPQARTRLVDPAHTAAIYRNNGDVLPTFLVDGVVAGVWSTVTDEATATLRVQPFARLRSKDRDGLTDEAQRLIGFLAPDAANHEVTWAS